GAAGLLQLSLDLYGHRAEVRASRLGVVTGPARGLGRADDHATQWRTPIRYRRGAGNRDGSVRAGERHGSVFAFGHRARLRTCADREGNRGAARAIDGDRVVAARDGARADIWR